MECCVALDIPTQAAQGARKREEREAEGRGAEKGNDRERAKDEPSKAIAAQVKAEEEQRSVKEEQERAKDEQSKAIEVKAV